MMAPPVPATDKRSGRQGALLQQRLRSVEDARGPLGSEGRALAHSTWDVQDALTPGGGVPRRLMLTTGRPVRTASSVMRLPTNPLPPNTTSRGAPPAPPAAASPAAACTHASPPLQATVPHVMRHHGRGMPEE